MKKITFLILSLISYTYSIGQNNVPLTNADIESPTPMTTTNNVKYAIDGMYINEAVNGSFDETNSGLAPGQGEGSSQALKVVTQNSGSTLSWHTQFVLDQVDISAYGSGDYTYSFRIKSATTPAAYPIWITLRTYDEDGTEVTANTVTNYSAGGQITSDAGVPGSTVGDMATAYQTAWNTFTIISNSGGGKDAKFLDLRVQMSKEVNTYYLDNVALQTTATLSTKEFERLGVRMYPNPANSYSYIKSETNLENIALYSVTGKLVMNKAVNSRDYQLDVSSLARGLYLLNIQNSKGTATTKLVVN